MADVNLSVTVPEEWIGRVFTAFTALAGKGMSIEVHDTLTELEGHWGFTIDPQGSDTVKQFGERFLRSLGVAAIKLCDYAEDNERYRDEVSIIIPPTQDVPEDILE